MMTFDKVRDWAMKAAPGASLIYHKGSQLSNIQKRHDYSDAVWGARFCYNCGLVDLVQKVEGPTHNRTFYYTAIRKSVVKPPDPAYSIDGSPIHLFPIPERFLSKKAA